MDQLSIKEKVGVNYMLMELSGEAVASTVTELQEKVLGYIVDTNVVLDTEHLAQVDSSGVGVILAGHNDGEASGTKLFVMNPSESTKRALERTGFYDLFHVIHSVTEVSND